MSFFYSRTCVRISVNRKQRHLGQYAYAPPHCACPPPQCACAPPLSSWIKDLRFLDQPTKHVRFDDHLIIHEYETENICLQEYLEQWRQCKLIHLQNTYYQKYGTLIGFNFDKECRLSDKEDKIYI